MHAFYRVTIPTAPAAVNLTCAIDPAFVGDSVQFDYTISNPTGSDFRGIKAMVSD
jgi:hypothetical protein